MGRKRWVFIGLLTALGFMCVATLVVWGLVFTQLNRFPGLSALLGPASAANISAPAVTGGPTVGAAAFDFTSTGLDQKPLTLSQYRGKAVLVNFWATWCGPCSAEMPDLEKVYQQHRDDLVVLGVNQGETLDEARGYADIYHLDFPIVLDQHFQIGDRYRVQGLPTTVFIDRTGVVRAIHIGQMSPSFIAGEIKALFGL